MLSALTINHLNLSSNPLSSQPFEIQKAIVSLLQTFEDGIYNKLESKFYLAPIDCGIGKTRALSCFLHHWKRSGFVPDNGVLVAVRTLEDTAQIIKVSGLEEKDYAVQTPDVRYRECGLGADLSRRAKVLFITHAMLKKRLAKKKLRHADEFSYRGKTRALRVCDEGILPAEPLYICVDRLLGLVAPLRPFDESYVERVIALVASMRAAKVNSTFSVPGALRRYPAGMKLEDNASPAPLSVDERNLVQALAMAAGRELRLVDNKKYGRALVGMGSGLPDDLAPMIIMDASARVRSLYDVWQHDRGNLIRLPAATNRYDNLHLSVWKRASGRSTLATPKDRDEILNSVAKLINAKADEGWLVICFKDNDLAGLAIERELRARLAREANVGFVSWWLHVGTNAFRACRNVVVIGAFRQPEQSYQARYMAASGKPTEAFSGDEWKDIWQGELQEVILQVVCRANVRNSLEGVCGECNVHLVLTPSPDPMAMLKRTFPGATIREWNPVLPKLSGQTLALVEKLQELKAAGYKMIAKSRLREQIGIESESRLGQLFSMEKVQCHFRALDIHMEHKAIYFHKNCSLAA